MNTVDIDIRKEEITGGVHRDLRHDSAHKHVSGEADYIDDLALPEGGLHMAAGLSDRAHADILTLDLSEVRATPGVVLVLTHEDIPGHNDIGPNHRGDEPLLAEKRIEFHGQMVFVVVAETREIARTAARKAKFTYHDLPHATDILDARAMGYKNVTDPLTLKRGDAVAALETAPRRLQGAMRIGGQEHFYLESHIALAIPGEDDEVVVWSSTQHPSEIQHMVANILQIPVHAVTVNTRRMGGGFGGKETQGNQFAALAALAAKRLNRAIKFRPDRDEDMVMTGKRHDFLAEYDVGFDDQGQILAVKTNYAARCGFSSDLSGPVTDRALFHADNAYFYPNVLLTSEPIKTNTVSNTAFRGFGGPQGLVGAERIIEEIAYQLGVDPLEIRKRNFYAIEGDERCLTPYHQKVEDNVIHRVVEELEASSDYQARRKAIVEFNKTSRVIRKGIALTPVKFGISFTFTPFNQAGALVHVYQDGSVHLNHGGTEMGQGLHIKVAQVVAQELGLSFERIRVTATDTFKVVNTSATAASTGPTGLFHRTPVPTPYLGRSLPSWSATAPASTNSVLSNSVRRPLRRIGRCHSTLPTPRKRPGPM